MKKITAIVAAISIVASLAAGCAAGKADIKPTMTATATPEPIATMPPDYSGGDFSGKWRVSGVKDSAGRQLSESEIKELGNGFTLELLPGAVYFVYDSKDKLLGQGTYGVDSDKLVLDAGGQQTAYQIIDTNTLSCTFADGSVTVMARIADVEEPEESGVVETAGAGESQPVETGSAEPVQSPESSASGTPESSATPSAS